MMPPFFSRRGCTTTSLRQCLSPRPALRDKNEDGERSQDRKAKEARKMFMAIEDGFAAAIGEEAIKQSQEVRSRSRDAFDASGTMAPIGYHYFGAELIRDKDR
jgi:hypothetical protein